MSARDTALNVLITCRREDGWSNGILKRFAAKDGLDRRDAALASRLCYGVLQNRLLLDFYLDQLLTEKKKKLHPVVRDILHLGLYQIYFADRIPHSAVVNESVSLAERYCRGNSGAPGLVNAVLRRASRTKGTLTPPRSYVDRYSHPQKLVDLLKQDVGKEKLEKLLIADNEIAPMTVQVNTLRTTAEELTRELEDCGVTVTRHGWMPDCLILTGTGDLERLTAFREGKFYVQDCAAKLSVLCAGLRPGSRVLDCCAAPGGKSFAAAIAMGNTGSVRSCDIHEHKLPLLEKGAERLGLSVISVQKRDAAEYFPQWESTMDTVLADVPCSGYGIIRKKPDIRYKDPDTVADLPMIQKQILTVQARYVKPGGILLYSTCTLLRRENEDVIEAFLRENPGFAPEALPLPPVFGENTAGYITLIPGEYDTDGFFICRLRRTV